MYIERVPNRSSPPAVLLRESYREDGKVKKRTIANLSSWPESRVEALRAVLKGATAIGKLDEAFDIERSLPHGHVAAVLAMLRKLGIERMLGAKRTPERDRVVAMIVARILDPRSKLATARGLHSETALSSLAEELDLESADAQELYAAMDWLVERQSRIEQRLAKRHLEDGSLVLYDVTSSYFEGRHCPLAKRGHSRDGKKGTLQIVIGLLTDGEGRPNAVEVFEGNTGDPTTFTAQVEKVRTRFALKRVVWVGDRGMITEARIRDDLKPHAGLEWITALRGPAIRELVEGGSLQLDLFDERDLAEIHAPDYPGERLIVCRNPLLAIERARKRQDLLQATERDLEKIHRATERKRKPLRGEAQIGDRVGQVVGKYKMRKHFVMTITPTSLCFERDNASIEREAALDGFYVIRTNVPSERLETEHVVRTYKGLSVVERAFRSLKTVDLKIRPIHHRLEDRVRAHVFLCMLAYYVEWHMREALRPMLFDDEEHEVAEAMRTSVVAPAQRSPQAKSKAVNKRTHDDQPVHSFRTLLADLATLTKNHVVPKIDGAEPFVQYTRPTPVHTRAIDLLGVKL